MADNNDITRSIDLTRDEVVAANLARLGVKSVHTPINVMRERVFKKSVEMSKRDGVLPSSVAVGRELGIGQSKAHAHLQDLADAGRMILIGSGSHARYMPLVED